MTQLYWLGGAVFCNVVFGIALYYSAKKQGKLEEQNTQCQRLLEGQAYSMRTLEAQVERADEKMHNILARIDHLGVAMLPDNILVEMFKDPTVVEKTKP